MARAKLIRTLRDSNGYGKTAFYEYRGYEYIIHFCNNGCMDDMNIAREHREEQNKIDYKIAHKNEPIEIKKGTFDADAIFDLLEMEVQK